MTISYISSWVNYFANSISATEFWFVVLTIVVLTLIGTITSKITSFEGNLIYSTNRVLNYCKYPNSYQKITLSQIIGLLPSNFSKFWQFYLQDKSSPPSTKFPEIELSNSSKIHSMVMKYISGVLLVCSLVFSKLNLKITQPQGVTLVFLVILTEIAALLILTIVNNAIDKSAVRKYERMLTTLDCFVLTQPNLISSNRVCIKGHCSNKNRSALFNYNKSVNPTKEVTMTKNEAPRKPEVEVPVEKPVDAPVETPTKIPVETPIKAPVETPVEIPVETPVEAPVETPVKPPLAAPTDIVETSVETPILQKDQKLEA